MKRKNILFLILIVLGIMFSITKVHASSEITDRKLAIASAYSYMPSFKKNKPISSSFSGISELANKVNTKFNLHNYADLKEIGDWIVEDYNGLKSLKQKGLNVLRIINGNNVIITIEGSFSPVDAYEDIMYGIKNYTAQEKYLKEYVNKTLDEYSKKDGDYNFYVTGHSLGGYLAQIGGAEVYKSINEKGYTNLSLSRVVSFNGMGINFFTHFGEKFNYGSHAETIEILKKINEEKKLISYYVYGDLVSALGVHYGEMREVVPSIDSIAYHRTNYAALKSFGSKLVKLVNNDTSLNILKTNLSDAQDFYQVGNIAAYLNLTHEIDHFMTLDVDSSESDINIKIIQSKNVLSSHVEKAAKKISTTKSLKLKALTSYASAKKYEWFKKNENGTWDLVKTVDMYDLNGDKIDNTISININDIPAGSSAYYKVISYYDDNYATSVQNLNSDNNKYEYIETDNSKNEELRSVQSNEIEIYNKNKKPSSTKTVSKISSFLKKLFGR